MLSGGEKLLVNATVQIKTYHSWRETCVNKIELTERSEHKTSGQSPLIKPGGRLATATVHPTLDFVRVQLCTQN